MSYFNHWGRSTASTPITNCAREAIRGLASTTAWSELLGPIWLVHRMKSLFDGPICCHRLQIEVIHVSMGRFAAVVWILSDVERSRAQGCVCADLRRAACAHNARLRVRARRVMRTHVYTCAPACEILKFVYGLENRHFYWSKLWKSDPKNQKYETPFLNGRYYRGSPKTPCRFFDKNVVKISFFIKPALKNEISGPMRMGIYARVGLDVPTCACRSAHLHSCYLNSVRKINLYMAWKIDTFIGQNYENRTQKIKSTKRHF